MIHKGEIRDLNYKEAVQNHTAIGVLAGVAAAFANEAQNITDIDSGLAVVGGAAIGAAVGLVRKLVNDLARIDA